MLAAAAADVAVFTVWMLTQVATLLRLASLDDHLFLLNHILRCPAGISRWAAVSYVQPLYPDPATTAPDDSADVGWTSNVLLDHVVAMLAMLLQPIRSTLSTVYSLSPVCTVPSVVYQKYHVRDL